MLASLYDKTMKGLSIHQGCLWLDNEPLLSIIVPERGSIDRQHKINRAKTLLIKIVNEHNELAAIKSEQRKVTK